MTMNFGDLSNLDDLVFIDKELHVMLSDIEQYNIQDIEAFIDEFFMDNIYKQRCLVQDIINFAELRPKYMDKFIQLRNHLFNSQSYKTELNVYYTRSQKEKRIKTDKFIQFPTQNNPYVDDIFNDRDQNLINTQYFNQNIKDENNKELHPLEFAAKYGATKCFEKIFNFVKQNNNIQQISQQFANICHYAVMGGSAILNIVMQPCNSVYNFNTDKILLDSILFHRYDIFDVYKTKSVDYLYEAVECSNLYASMWYILENESNVCATTAEHKLIPIFKSINYRSFSIAKMLLDFMRCPDADDVSYISDKCLCYSAGWDDLYMSQLLLYYHEDPNKSTSTGRYPIHSCIPKGYLDIAELYLEYGADINATNRDNKTAFIETIPKKNINSVQFLIDHGANPLIAKNTDGMTALHVAVEEQSQQICSLIMQANPKMLKDNKGQLPQDIAKEIDSASRAVFGILDNLGMFKNQDL